MPQLIPEATIESRDLKETLTQLSQKGEISSFLGFTKSAKGILMLFFSERFNKDVLILVKSEETANALTTVFEVL